MNRQQLVGTKPLRSAISGGVANSALCVHPLLFFIAALILCTIVVGCGSDVQDGKTQSSSEVATRRETASTAVAGEAPNTIPATKQTPPDSEPKIPAPSAEQIALWTPAPFEPLQLLAIRQWETTSFTSQLAALPDGKHFLVAGSRVLLWSLTGDEPEHVFLDLAPDDPEREILSLALAPDGKWFAVGDNNGMVRIWNLEDRQEIVARDLDSNGVTDLAISPDGEEIAAISYDSEVTTWDAADLQPRNQFNVDTNNLKRIEYLAPNMLAVAGETTSVWNTSHGQLVQQLSPGRYSFALARSPDGSRLIFGGDDALHIWHIAEFKEEATISQGVSGSELLAWSPDGEFLAATNGRLIAVWNLTERRMVQVIDSFGWAVVGMSWLPETNMLAVASEIGVTRVWGTPDHGETVGLKPLHEPIALPDPASKQPAGPAQLLQVIDLRTFPRLPGAEPSIVASDSFYAVVPVGVDEAKSFYKYFLQQAGWEEAVGQSANPTAVQFRKGGFLLGLSCYDAGDGKTNVSLNHAGNYDLRWAPKFDATPTESVYESESTVSYRTKADLLTIETTLLRIMNAAGWTPYTRLNSSHSEERDARDMEFLNNGATLRISIGKFPADPTSYTIQSSLFSNSSSAPVPPDSGFVEFDGSTAPALVAITSKSLDEALQFYNDQLVAEGWLIRTSRQADEKDRAWLTCIRGQSDLSVGFLKLRDGRTLVRIGEAVGSLWEKSQPDEDADDPQQAVGLEAADMPLLNASQSGEFDALDKSIEVRISDATLAEAAERYTTALKALGCKVSEGGIRSEDYTMISFTKDGGEFTLRARLQDGDAVVNFQGDGLLWNKELPGGKQLVSYERWLRQNKHPPELVLLDQYESEMRAVISSQESANPTD